MSPHPLAVTAFLVGCVLVLSELRWFRRIPLDRRIAPYLPGGSDSGDGPRGATPSLRALLAPLALWAGTRATQLLGVTEEVGVRLERLHRSTSPTEFRLRQLGWATGAFFLAALVAVGASLPGTVAVLFLLGAPLLAFLLVEHVLANESKRCQQRVFLELPVVAEHLGMLVSSGFSVGAALNRIADGGTGAVARDLHRVCRRIRHGVAEGVALDEWAAVSGVPAVGRLVSVLSLDREATDLGRLITEEARATRREVHRTLIETIERRAQQVWIPVTVATLVPGVLFISVPFITAMQLFARS